ncbi:hypothetical protein ACHAXM_011279, partial [Skeletonema potamos]
VLHALLWQQRGGSLGGFASADQHDAKSGVGLRGSEGGKRVDGIAGEVLWTEGGGSGDSGIMPKHRLSTLVDDSDVASKHSKATNRELNLFSSSSGNETTDFSSSSMNDPTSLVVASNVATPTLEWNQLKSLGLCVGIKVKGNAGDEKNLGTVGTSEILEESTSTQHHRALNIYTQRMFKERREGRAIIPYTIDESNFGADDLVNIDDALQELEVKTGSLEFIHRDTQLYYIKVERRANKCHKVGSPGGEITVNLGEGCMAKGIIQHEFMHALGLVHEQSRPDRDQYVTILWDNIEDLRQRPQFEIHGGSETLDSPYDYSSVMHYKDDAFAKANTKTILPKGGNTIIFQRDGPTNLDSEKLKLLYQCESGARKWGDLINNPCTSDCKCREGVPGCGSNDDACHGTLVCIDNKCSTPPSTPNPVPSTSPDLWGPYEIGQSFPVGAED